MNKSKWKALFLKTRPKQLTCRILGQTLLMKTIPFCCEHGCGSVATFYVVLPAKFYLKHKVSRGRLCPPLHPLKCMDQDCVLQRDIVQGGLRSHGPAQRGLQLQVRRGTGDMRAGISWPDQQWAGSGHLNLCARQAGKWVVELMWLCCKTFCKTV